MTWKRGLGIVVLVVLTLTAGCSALSGGETAATETATAEPTVEPEPETEELPPLATRAWANESGLNRTALFLNLSDRLNGTSGYSIRFATTVKRLDGSGNGPGSGNTQTIETTVDIEPEQAMHVTTTFRDGEERRGELQFLTNGTHNFNARFAPNGTRVATGVTE